MKNESFNWKVNNQIRAPLVRVIGPDGKAIGIMKLQEAIEKSRTLNLDLVEVAPNADPPVTRIVELGKFRYQEEKKLRKEKKGVKGGDTKEIRFSPFIGDADYKNRIERIQEFLDEKDKIRVVVKFGGRQMGSKIFGYKLIERIFAEFGDNISIDMQPKFLGRHLTTVISPHTAKKTPEDEKEIK